MSICNLYFLNKDQLKFSQNILVRAIIYNLMGKIGDETCKWTDID
jgi:hypothetical protein